MSNRAVEHLFLAYERLRIAEVEYWALASELVDQGLVHVEDVAVIYGIHPQTARKRLAEGHYHQGD